MVIRLDGRKRIPREAGEPDRELLLAGAASMLDPQVLLEAVRDSAGRVVDFTYRSVNRAACSHLGKPEGELLGGLEASGLTGRYAECLDTGEPVIIDEFAFCNGIFDDSRRYDIRATRVGPDLISLTWRDVTERFLVAQQRAVSENNFRLMAAEAANAAEAARRQQARADERYRRSIEHAAVATCLTKPDGRLHEVNDAACRLFGYDAETLKRKTWLELTPPENLDEDRKKVRDLHEGRIDSFRLTKQFIHADGHLIWVDLSVSCLRDEDGNVEHDVALITDVTAEVEAAERNRALAQQLQRQADLLADSEKTYRLLVENSGDVVCHLRDNSVVWISPSVEAVLGAPPEYWLGRSIFDSVHSEDESVIAAMLGTLADGGSVQQRVRVLSPGGVMHWLDLHAKPFYDDDGRQDGVTAALRPIDDKVASEQALEEARRQQARADQRYRRSVDNAAIGMGLVTPDGAFVEVNEALCRLFGYGAEVLKQKTWQELTAQEYLEADQQNADDILAGRIDSYRMVKQYIHADGHLIWGDLSVSCVRDENGHVENLIKQIIDISAEVEAKERNRILTQRLQRQTELMTNELESAAAYMSSIMPTGLAGKVVVASRYLPSHGLGGDCFDYTWIDDDHLLVYLIDVSGHGIEPALLAVSVHNMIRSGSLSDETLRAPHQLLTELNRRFQMKQHKEHYFTMWCGVYEASTRSLCYACAGAPPALALDPRTGEALAITDVSTNSLPIGMFEDTDYTSATYSVPPGCRILLYSDGAWEFETVYRRNFTLEDFKSMTARLASSPGGSIDELIDLLIYELRALSATGHFEDDCSLIALRVD